MTKSALRRPQSNEAVPYFFTYIDKVPGNDFLAVLKSSFARQLAQYQALTPAQWDHRYAPGKWSVREVLIHLMDSERVFAYRALRISRNDPTPMAGFEQDDYVPHYEAEGRSIPSLLEEYELLRRSSVAFFGNMTPTMLERTGTASGGTFSVLALGYMIAGHELHHEQLYRERYQVF